MYFARVAANVYKQTEKTKEERDKLAVSLVSQQGYISHTGHPLHSISWDQDLDEHICQQVLEGMHGSFCNHTKSGEVLVGEILFSDSFPNIHSLTNI